MSKKASDFVTKLSKDPELAKAFAEDPDAAMANEDLSDADKEALKSGDDARIRTYLGDDGPPGCMILLV